MAISNFHMHTIFCDGKNDPEDYVVKAIEKGMKYLGFSAHGPIHFSNNWNMKAQDVYKYFDEIERLKKKYFGIIEIYAGFEMDYLNGDSRETAETIRGRLDYTIGSVHYVQDEGTKNFYTVDGSPEDFSLTVSDYGSGSVQKTVCGYFEALKRIIREQKFDILGHFDVIKKNNKGNVYFREDSPWYQKMVYEVLHELEQREIIVEVSTGGRIRGYIQDTYPSTWIVRACQEKNIPIILNSDANWPEAVNSYFDESIEMLKGQGIRTQRILVKGKWTDIKL